VTQQTSPADLYAFNGEATAVLNEAWQLPPGPQRAEAMKRAGVIRNAAVESLFTQAELGFVSFVAGFPTIN
jgi:hypothetical protein